MTDTQFEVLCERMDHVKDNVALALKLLNGNGEPEKGIVTRLDRVEGTIRRAGWVVKTAVIAAATALFALLAEIIKG